MPDVWNGLLLSKLTVMLLPKILRSCRCKAVKQTAISGVLAPRITLLQTGQVNCIVFVFDAEIFTRNLLCHVSHHMA